MRMGDGDMVEMQYEAAMDAMMKIGEQRCDMCMAFRSIHILVEVKRDGVAMLVCPYCLELQPGADGAQSDG